MKKLFTLVISSLITLSLYAQSAVPSECPDVLLQAFYYDSYEVDSTHAGTEIYGDTKWKTLQTQAGEIGAYFDLVWLPPSSLADGGTGYQTKQYCNQNSAWGSRAELEKLISTFHNSGTKVVADIVINHAEAMTSWCDMAAEDFDQYGLFQPDGSYITSGDEINWSETMEYAGDCWGYSQNSRADDGQNWDSARDWAHDNPDVQEMFKAYLKWMKNVMHYDGWRYDKGDGYNNWHMYNYNQASEPYIAFEERYDGNAENLKNGIRDAQMNMMALDFALKFSSINAMQGWNYVGRGGLIGNDVIDGDYYKKHAVTWVENHDMFLRDDNDLEFCGRGNSMKPEIKARLLGANAFILAMPGVPCIFYPHWAKYKAEIKDMINARHLAGVHSESEVRDEEWDWDAGQQRNKGYKATIVGKNGWLILCLGTKANQQGFGPDYKLVASMYSTFNDHGNQINESYEMWVYAVGDAAPGLMVTPSTFFEDSVAGINVTAQAVGGSCATPTIYYTTDGSVPTTNSPVYTGPLNFKQTTTLKIMAACGIAQSKVQTYTYTYREPLQRGIRLRFNKPESWDKVYIYAWRTYKDEQGEDASENIMGAYPGQRIYQDVEGWYAYEFDQSIESVNFCINSGDDCGSINVRSNDLVTDYDVCYGWMAGKDTMPNQEVLIDCETKLYPAFDIAISPESGYFRDQTEGIDVTINAIGKENAMIYYTTDGSEPTTASQNGLSPITFKVTQATTVKAFAYDPITETRTATSMATYTYKAPQSGPLTVKFIKPEEWEDLYLYAFTRVKVDGRYKDTPYSLDGRSPKWPGMKWTQMDGEWYTHTMPADRYEIYIIFTEGKNKPQTQDIFLYENACYVWNPDCRRAVLDVDCDGIVEGIVEPTCQSYFINDTVRLCALDTMLWHGQVIRHSGRIAVIPWDGWGYKETYVEEDSTYTASYVTADGCDSVYTRHVHFSPSYFASITDTIQWNEPCYLCDQLTQTSSNVYEGHINLVSREGCDSLQYWNVVIASRPQYTISLAVNSSRYGSVDGEGTFPKDTIVQIWATPKKGYQFNQWSDGNMDNPRQITVTRDEIYTAVFGTKICSWEVESNDLEMGAVITTFNEPSYNYGTQITVEASPNSGYKFVKWNDGKKYNPYRFSLLDDKYLLAIFMADEQEQDTTTVEPATTSATFTWPFIEGGYSYSLTIYLDEACTIPFCTLTFNQYGQLIEIRFNTSVPRRMPQEEGFTYTVSGLNANTKYYFKMETKDEDNKLINTDEGSFETNEDGTAINPVTTSPVPQTVKLVRDGQIFIIRGDKMYTVTGQQVR